MLIEDTWSRAIYKYVFEVILQTDIAGMKSFSQQFPAEVLIWFMTIWRQTMVLLNL